jgi:hypothetical protein
MKRQITKLSSNSKRGQQIAEYAFMIGLVAMVAIGMQYYVTRRVSRGLGKAAAIVLGTEMPNTQGNSTKESSGSGTSNISQSGLGNGIIDTSIHESSSSSSSFDSAP